MRRAPYVSSFGNARVLLCVLLLIQNQLRGGKSHALWARKRTTPSRPRKLCRAGARHARPQRRRQPQASADWALLEMVQEVVCGACVRTKIQLEKI